MNFHQSPQEIIKAATPECRILWNHIFQLCGERTSISQLFFQNTIPGTEFETFRAGRLYLGLEVEFSYPPRGGLANPMSGVIFYDENDVESFYGEINSPVIDSMDAIWDNFSNYLTRNIYFSRVEPIAYTYMRFCGYRITY
jgi:hypothetical protein